MNSEGNARMLITRCIMALALVRSAGGAVECDGKQLGEMSFFIQHNLCKIVVCLRCKHLGKVSGKYMPGILLEFM